MTTLHYINKLFKSHIFKIESLRLRYESSQNLQITSESTPPKVKRKRSSASQDVENYLLSKDNLTNIKHQIPSRLLKRNRKAPDDLYLVDSDVAKDIISALEPHIKNKNKTLIETNPGFGFVTEGLLACQSNKIHIYETVAPFRDNLLALDEKYPDRIKVYNRDFFSIWRLSYQDKYDNGNRVKRMLSSIKMKQWDDDPAMTIIGTTASSNFIRHLLISLIFQFGVMTYGRCELFLILPPHLYIQLTAGPDVGYLVYRASSALFQIFCDHEVLLKVPRKAFLPWDSTKNKRNNLKLHKIQSIDADYMYLTRIEFKKDLPVPPNRYQHIWYFIQHMMISRTHKVIPSLEKWVPGFGLRFILSSNNQNVENDNIIFPNMDIFTQTGNLTPLQLLHIYKEFSSLPCYLESSFIASMEVALLKSEHMHDLDEVTETNESESTINKNIEKTVKTESESK